MREPFPVFVNSNEESGSLPSKRDVLSFRGSLVYHMQVGGWVRCVSQLLARFGAGSRSDQELVPMTRHITVGKKSVWAARFDELISEDLCKAMRS